MILIHAIFSEHLFTELLLMAVLDFLHNLVLPIINYTPALLFEYCYFLVSYLDEFYDDTVKSQ